MNIFVASWFFPPATSSEGIVTYKLLRNSKNSYDVFSSTSQLWGYQSKLNQESETNIHCFHIDTDSIDCWVEACVKKFDELNTDRKYQCIMTRSMPPESIQVGLRIKEKYPNIKWIASMADPIANNPYELKAYVDDCASLSDAQKKTLREALRFEAEEKLSIWEKRPEPGSALMCRLKRLENSALRCADMILAPTGRQLRYTAGEKGWNSKFRVIPHSYDPLLFPPSEPREVHDRIILSYIGYSDELRSLEPVVKALRALKQEGSPAYERLEVRFVGNHPRQLKDLVLNYFLDDCVRFESGVDYFESLRLMKQSDWLIHVDAYFPWLNGGGSIFFAAKLADYMGSRRPIFALTGTGSPADEIVTRYGGITVNPWEIDQIALQLERIALGEIKTETCKGYAERYAASNVADRFDTFVAELFVRVWKPRTRNWPTSREPKKDKLVTVCVPCYQGERYLERCLGTLLNHVYAGDTEILVIDDGSSDHTARIGEAFENDYPGIVRLIRKANGGHGSTINTAIREGSGRYFMVVDCDDWIDSTAFEALLGKITSGEIDSDIVSSNYHEIDMETGVSSPWVQNAEIEYFKKLPFEKLDVEHIYFTLASSLIKLSLLKKMNRPLHEKTYYVDVEYILYPIPYIETAEFVDYYIYKYCRGNAEQSVYIPTMVNRYEHHERVMKAVLEYRKAQSMTLAQAAYYDAVLKRLLYTHYALFMVYDTDKQRGLQRGKEFDAYLITAHPDLAKWIANEMRIVKLARKYKFNYGKIESSKWFALLGLRMNIKTAVKEQAKKNKMIKALLFNRFTVRVAKWSFFSEGKGKALKEKVKQTFSGK